MTAGTKRIMMVGPVAAGKTTLSQSLNGSPNRDCTKTQTIQVIGAAIDTPGEYLENRKMANALSVTALDADMVLFVQDARMEYCWFAPGQSEMFPCPVAGVVTKTDIACREEIDRAVGLLRYAGADPVFCISCFENDGVSELEEYLLRQ
jgi:ethanolamine utilization protein EutP